MNRKNLFDTWLKDALQRPIDEDNALRDYQATEKEAMEEGDE